MIVLIRGGGDLASGVALRLYRSGLKVVITELAEPLAVRRLVSFSEAIYAGEFAVEGITARRVKDPADSLRVLQILAKGQIPVSIDPDGVSAQSLHPGAIVDARMRKIPPEPLRHNAYLYIGLGPGFHPPHNCHAAVETNRGHLLGRVYWDNAPEADTQKPDPVLDKGDERVLRAPTDGELSTHAEIGQILEPGQPIAEVGGQMVSAPFRGVLRGLLRSGMQVSKGFKIGDLDPRADPALCTLVSDKALAVGGGVLETLLTRLTVRKHLWD